MPQLKNLLCEHLDNRITKQRKPQAQDPKIATLSVSILAALNKELESEIGVPTLIGLWT
ncbi:hypothetical protein [Ktedonosporobacter rubrisoli]|uniref:hypothetical protein n=1 Tax=Ktedonosporobacter rubrisoli TaxID=2509675 RepID=UPI0013EE843C|nr:hypothetical protein [Ktedonosporobacter rubrisoli]